MPLRMSDFESMSFDEAISAMGMNSNSLNMNSIHIHRPNTRMTIVGPFDMDMGMPMQLLSLLSGLGSLTLLDSDQLQTQLLQQQEPQWTPALKNDIQNLPLVTLEPKHIQKVENKNCSVCQEDFNVGEQVNQLPCYHFFHKECIHPWLEKNRTCPLCRKEVVDIQPTTKYMTQPTHNYRQESPNTHQHTHTPNYPQYEYLTRQSYEPRPTANERIYQRQPYERSEYVHPNDYYQRDRSGQYYTSPQARYLQPSNYITTNNNNIYGNTYQQQPMYQRAYYQQPRYYPDQRSSNSYYYV